MVRSPRDIRISEDEPQVAPAIEAALLKSLRDAAPQAENTGFVLSARTTGNELVAGLAAGTSYGWLLIKTLWVDEAHRGRGLGRALMQRAEDKARAAMCHGAWLDTSNADAMRFYTKLGYAPFGQLDNSAGQQPDGHRRWFMKKYL